MRIFVKDLLKNTITLDVDPSDTIVTVKSKLYDAGADPDTQEPKGRRTMSVVASVLFSVGSCLFTIDSVHLIHENGFDFRSSMYSLGSILFLIGSLMWFFDELSGVR
mmetsp:Transcript_15982/g.28674  ORF Transcript_15982/g.28674 Transcript_15982/m.28674 type:complete len:107 (-) Transcript_15982:623-943(-)